MCKAKTTKPVPLKDIPRTWDALTKMLPLRPVHDDVDCENATEVIDMMAGHDLNKDQADYLDALATLVIAYEEDRYPFDVSHITGVQVLKSLLADHDMNASDLGKLLGVHRSHASKILNGERSLTTDHLRVLGEHFRLNPSVFL